MNNLAELSAVTINRAEIETEWEKQVRLVPGYVWDNRNYVSESFFTDYFRNLLNTIVKEVGITPKNYVLQIHDKRLVDEKWYLNITHKDDDRLTCITIPILYNKLEPIRFYDDALTNLPRGKPTTEKPVQTSTYSDLHPTLVNVNNWHNVRIIDQVAPRILLQLSYDETFDNIIGLNSSKWKIIR
jgi:hypothetical protein